MWMVIFMMIDVSLFVLLCYRDCEGHGLKPLVNVVSPQRGFDVLAVGWVGELADFAEVGEVTLGGFVADADYGSGMEVVGTVEVIGQGGEEGLTGVFGALLAGLSETSFGSAGQGLKDGSGVLQ